MKKILFLLLLAFTGATASGQPGNLLNDRSSMVADSLRKMDREVNSKFLNKGNTLMNMRGSIPESLLIQGPRHADKLKNEDTNQEKLIVNTLLFTGKLQDHISRPFMTYRDTLNLKQRIEY